LLSRLGFETATGVWAGILFACSAPLTFFIRPRLPTSATAHIKPFNMRYVVSRLFTLYQLVNFIQAMGYFLPGIYLPTYARQILNIGNFLSALTLMLTNISATIGCVIGGTLTDSFHVSTCIIISAVGTATAVLLVWGLAQSLPVLYVFCVMYGHFAGSWTAVYPGIMKEVAKRGEDAGYGHADPVMLMGHLLLWRGVGNLISGPLSKALVDGMPWKGQTLAGYGSGYGRLMIFSGLTGFVSGMSFLLRWHGK
ncbi:major facilitator superfamily domain-containing protein, partial [Pyrenochaeta sp. MPI-SDFR-AT-0127]